ncbi:tryptophan-rich sensory protein [Corticicoccus populi]|uniref:Tryptophan-rich sensory protein n=1 Tax=Corticicoccus populi TaxID=1812821 RepID=A0ABW5WVS2_9STAP
MNSQRKWAVIYLIGFSVMIFLNYWSAVNVGIVADENQALIQPAGFAFSIWGLIYILLFIWIIKVFFSETGAVTVKRLHIWPLINFLLNGLWILVFTAGWILLSSAVIILLLVTLIKMYTETSNQDYHWFDRLPFSVYFGWVTAASVVNIFTLLVSYNQEMFLGIPEISWTLLAVLLITVLTVYIGFQFRDWLYPLVIVWTYSGIYIENDNMYPLLDIILILSIAVMIVLVLFEGVKKVKLSKS